MILAIIVFFIVAGTVAKSSLLRPASNGGVPNKSVPSKTKYIILKKLKGGSDTSSIAMQKIRLYMDMNRQIPSSNLVVSASSTGLVPFTDIKTSPLEVINYAEPNTFWVSESRDSAQEWIKIELKEPVMVTQIELDNYKGPTVKTGYLESYPYANRLKNAELTTIDTNGAQIYQYKFDNAPLKWGAIM